MTKLGVWERLRAGSVAAVLALAAVGPAAPALAQVTGSVDFTVRAAIPPSIPQPVTDLTAFSTIPVEGNITLTWSAPDGFTPPVGEPTGLYHVRYAPISVDLGGGTTAWWNAAAQAAQILSPPKPPGNAESMAVVGLDPGATMYFAIRSTNPTTSTLSPIDLNAVPPAIQASAIVPDMPPPAPSGLAGTRHCAQADFTWSSISTAAVYSGPGVTYDFSHYRLYEAGVGTWTAITPAAGTQGLAFTTEKNLQNFVTYYYQVRAVDRRINESTGNTTVPLVSYPVPSLVNNLDVNGSSTAPTLVVRWGNPGDSGSPNDGSFKGGILVRSDGAALTAVPDDRSTYLYDVVGSTFGNGTVIETWGNGTGGNPVKKNEFVDANLASGTTYYYSVFTFYKEQPGNIFCYSAAASKSIVLQPKPMAPAGVEFSGGAVDKVRWQAVTHFASGLPMPTDSGGAISANHLDGYNVYKSTCGAAGCGGANSWGAPLVNCTHIQGANCTVTLASGVNYFMVRAVNSFSFESDDSNTVDSSEQRYAIAKDASGNAVAQVTVPASLTGALEASGNSSGVELRVEVLLRPEDVVGTVRRSLEVRVVRGDNGAAIPDFQFAGGQVTLSMSALTLNGALGLRAAASADLDVFWWNGVRWLPLFGEVDAQTETVTVRTSATGLFQLRAVSRSGVFAFDPAAHLLPRVITPNGDGLNDIMFFITNVPGVTGKVFDIRGAKVADLKPGPPCPGTSGNQCLYWDGKASGKTVHSGIYIYDLNGQGKHFTGTAVVTR